MDSSPIGEASTPHAITIIGLNSALTHPVNNYEQQRLSKQSWYTKFWRDQNGFPFAFKQLHKTFQPCYLHILKHSPYFSNLLRIRASILNYKLCHIPRIWCPLGKSDHIGYCVCYSIIIFNQTHVFDWCVVRWR